MGQLGIVSLVPRALAAATMLSLVCGHVRRLAGSDVSTVPQLIGLMKEANLAQVVAVGVGLAGASAACKLTRPDLAHDIADQVTKAGIPALTSAFAVGATPLDADQMGAFVAPTEVAEITNSRVSDDGAMVTKKGGLGGDPAPGEGLRFPGLLFSRVPLARLSTAPSVRQSKCDRLRAEFSATRYSQGFQRQC